MEEPVGLVVGEPWEQVVEDPVRLVVEEPGGVVEQVDLVVKEPCLYLITDCCELLRDGRVFLSGLGLLQRIIK